MNVVTMPRVVARERVSYQRIARITLLQHKTAIVTFTALYGAIATALHFAGLSSHAAYSEYLRNDCGATPVHILSCVAAESTISTNTTILNAVLISLRLIPLIVAIFLGAPLLSREFESGTYLFVWTQGVGRIRWLVTKFVLVAGGVVVGSFLLGVVVNWFVAPFNSIGLSSRYQSGQFDLTPINFAAWTLLALVLGMFIGAILRQTLQSIATSMAVMGVLLVTNFLWIDNWLLSINGVSIRPKIGQVENVIVGSLNTFAYQDRSAAAPAGSWLVRSWITGPHGRVLSQSASQALLLVARTAKNAKVNGNAGQLSWLIAHHFSYWVTYQPSYRYREFQLLNGFVLVLISLGLVLTTTHILRRRKSSTMALFRTKLSRQTRFKDEQNDDELAKPGSAWHELYERQPRSMSNLKIRNWKAATNSKKDRLCWILNPQNTDPSHSIAIGRIVERIQ